MVIIFLFLIALIKYLPDLISFWDARKEYKKAKDSQTVNFTFYKNREDLREVVIETTIALRNDKHCELN